MDMEQEKTFENRAKFQEKTEEPYCQSCGEELIFGMKDNYHEFSLGLSTVLECLFVAEQNGSVPKIPSEWRILVFNRYPHLARNFNQNE